MRTIAYFGGHGVAGNLAIISACIVAAIAVTLIGTPDLNRRGLPDKRDHEPATGGFTIGADTPSLIPVPAPIAGVHPAAVHPSRTTGARVGAATSSSPTDRRFA